MQINTQQHLQAVHIVIYQRRRKTMPKMVLDEVYDLLKHIGTVTSESEFSADWLARSECYMRTLRFKQANPSVGTLAICASKLQHYASCMTATDAMRTGQAVY